MYLCIFSATVITVYKHHKQKTFVHLMRPVQDGRKYKITHFTVIADLNVVQKKSNMVTYLFGLILFQYMSAL